MLHKQHTRISLPTLNGRTRYFVSYTVKRINHNSLARLLNCIFNTFGFVTAFRLRACMRQDQMFSTMFSVFTPLREGRVISKL